MNIKHSHGILTTASSTTWRMAGMSWRISSRYRAHLSNKTERRKGFAPYDCRPKHVGSLFPLGTVKCKYGERLRLLIPPATDRFIKQTVMSNTYTHTNTHSDKYGRKRAGRRQLTQSQEHISIHLPHHAYWIYFTCCFLLPTPSTKCVPPPPPPPRTFTIMAYQLLYMNIPHKIDSDIWCSVVA